jgi:REP element-mobilizing transposase RayT
MKPNYKSTRLKEYDYRSCGAYFVTIVTWKRKCCLGAVKEDKVILSTLGESVRRSWQWLETYYPYVELDEFVVMPNHIHGIIRISDRVALEARLPVGKLVAAFKSKVSREQKERCLQSAWIWQKDFYEHVVRNEQDLQEIREYIVNNPLKWQLDKENPNNV